ncbi:putative mushroom body vesicular transporter portabella [Haematobia irritans]|uniref:putative mushroom body vesicular transporter portabella n=1 Tax=Haematobia irritans TaxID=7368 RepID=UPI003F4FC3E1
MTGHKQGDINVSSKLNSNELQNNGVSTLNQTYNQRRTSSSNYGTTSRDMIALIVYLALLLDNILLTVIVPILPDYLASINNRTLLTTGTGAGGTTATTAYNSPLNGIVAAAGLNASGGPSSLGSQHMAYRNMDETPMLLAQTQSHVPVQLQAHHQSSQSYPYHQQQTHQIQQHVMTKHPIPGKSMVNFSLIHLATDDNSALLISSALNKHGGNNSKWQNRSNDGGGVGKTTNGHFKNSLTLTTDKVNNNGRYGPNSVYNDELLASENGSIGILLAMKALVQLIFNPIVGNMSIKYGYRLPIVMGTFFLLVSSLVFAVGETYATLLIARATQGIGSACIGVCGMSLVAQHYPEEERRSKVMGIILGSIALGVLLGYPFGGILYDLFGKSAPFIILSTIIFINLGLQLISMDLSIHPEAIVDIDQQRPKWKPLLQSKMILAIVIAIWFSTSTMAILEPCLPLWLMTYLKPNKWQLGTVFIPDSIGYFVGTNFFGAIAYKFGQIKVSCLSLLLVGISSILIPTATTVAQLLLPHFGLGLGIGIIDAGLVPLLATFVDATLAAEDDMDTSDIRSSHSLSSYGSVYAIQQTSVSLAYCLAPLIGGELAQAFGFAWLMRIVGIFNIIYGPVLVYLYYKYDPKIIREKQHEMLLSSSGGSASCGRGSKYKQLYNSVDAE